jgi:hypothetical protein
MGLAAGGRCSRVPGLASGGLPPTIEAPEDSRHEKARQGQGRQSLEHGPEGQKNGSSYQKSTGDAHR